MEVNSSTALAIVPVIFVGVTFKRFSSNTSMLVPLVSAKHNRHKCFIETYVIGSVFKSCKIFALDSISPLYVDRYMPLYLMNY